MTLTPTLANSKLARQQQNHAILTELAAEAPAAEFNNHNRNSTGFSVDVVDV